MNMAGMQSGYNVKGFNREGIHKATGIKYDENGFDSWGRDYHIQIVQSFVEGKESKEKFCLTNKINIKDFDKWLEAVASANPEMAEKINTHNAKASAIYLSSVEQITKKILSGEIDVYQFARQNKGSIKVSDILSHTKSLETRKQIQAKVAEAVASGNLTMKDFVRLFSKEYDYKTVISSVEEFLKNAAYESPELQGRGKPINNARIKIKDLKKYEKQYQGKDFIGTQRGFISPKTGQVDGMIEITEEHFELAKRYLHLEDEYLCYNTVSQTISKLISGQIKKEEIEERESQVRKVQELKGKDDTKQELEAEASETQRIMEEAGALKAEYEELMPQQEEEKNQ